MQNFTVRSYTFSFLFHSRSFQGAKGGRGCSFFPKFFSSNTPKNEFVACPALVFFAKHSIAKSNGRKCSLVDGRATVAVLQNSVPLNAGIVVARSRRRILVTRVFFFTFKFVAVRYIRLRCAFSGAPMYHSPTFSSWHSTFFPVASSTLESDNFAPPILNAIAPL